VGSLVISQPRTHLIGTGNAILVFFGPEASHGIFPAIRADKIDDVLLQNISFQGVRNASHPTMGIKIFGCTHINIFGCSFANFLASSLSIQRADLGSGAWIVDHDPNLSESVSNLKALLASDVTIRHNIFSSPFVRPRNRKDLRGLLRVFGARDVKIDDNIFDYVRGDDPSPTQGIRPNSDPLDHLVGGGVSILCDDASTQTPLSDYAFNINIHITNNYSLDGDLHFIGTVSGMISNNFLRRILVISYDFDQQFDNFGERPKPFMYMDHEEIVGPRRIVLAANFTHGIRINSRWHNGNVGKSTANYCMRGSSLFQTEGTERGVLEDGPSQNFKQWNQKLFRDDDFS
jgi:hypothetical protein